MKEAMELPVGSWLQAGLTEQTAEVPFGLCAFSTWDSTMVSDLANQQCTRNEPGGQSCVVAGWRAEFRRGRLSG